MATLVAVLVTLGALTRTSELTVMRACGVSLYRAIAPLLVLAFIWSGLLFLLQEQVMAVSNRRAAALEDTIRGRPPRIARCRQPPLARRRGRQGLLLQAVRFAGRDDSRTCRSSSGRRPAVPAGPAHLRAARHVRARRYLARRRMDGSRRFARSGTSVRRRALPTTTSLALEPVSSFRSDEPESDLMTFAELRREVDRLRSSGFAFSDYAVAMQHEDRVSAGDRHHDPHRGAVRPHDRSSRRAVRHRPRRRRCRWRIARPSSSSARSAARSCCRRSSRRGRPTSCLPPPPAICSCPSEPDQATTSVPPPPAPRPRSRRCRRCPAARSACRRRRAPIARGRPRAGASSAKPTGSSCCSGMTIVRGVPSR